MKKSAHLTLVNDLETSAIEISDRGLAYGDGLFETLRVCDGKVSLLSYHLNRFKLGVGVLGLGDPETVTKAFERYVFLALEHSVKHAHLQRAVIKIMVTRGQGGRGYTPPQESALNFITQIFEYPEFPDSNYTQGISLHLCEHRISHQPVLAGIKHLNRLDQVLASREVESSGADEGVMLDYQGRVIEGTKSNIFIVQDDVLVTPIIDHAGVAGTLRQYLLDNCKSLGIEIREQQVTLEALKSAQALAVANSVFGLWPVKEFAGKSYAANKICEIIQSYLKTEFSY